jgi:hypothetical protein
MAKEKNMNQKLVRDIYDAVCKNVKHVIDHLDRDKTKDKNDHSNIEMFQRAICKELNKTSNCVYDSEQECKNCKNSWECEYSASGIYKDSIDIYGDLKDKNGKRPCIIEIDAVRHDQIAAKFVSRVALCGLEGPIDYVTILYDSSQDSGRQSAEKFIRYMYSVLKKINKDSALIGIFVHVEGEKDNHVVNVEIWDCLQQEYRIKEKIEDNKETNNDNNSDKGTYDSMVKCAKGAVEYYITKHPKVTFNKLQDIFKKKTSYYVFDHNEEGLRTKKIEETTTDREEVFVDSQFRSTGNLTNWLKFVKICKNNKITIEEKFKQQEFVKNPIEL